MQPTTIPISYSCELSHGEMAVESRVFKNWLSRINPLFGVTSITVTVVDFHSTPSTKSVLFIRLKVKTSTSPREQIVELRGGAAAMLVNLICEGVTYTVLVQQARIATGDFGFLEVPAGMIDHDSFAGAAAREIEEELGLVFDSSELVNITGPRKNEDVGLYLSPGLLDESCMFFLAERHVTRDELSKLQGSICGVAGEGEHITLVIIPLNDLPAITQDAKTILAWALYHKHKGNF